MVLGLAAPPDIWSWDQMSLVKPGSPPTTKYQHHLSSDGKLDGKPDNTACIINQKFLMHSYTWHAAMLCFYWHQVEVQSTNQLTLYCMRQMPELVSCSQTHQKESGLDRMATEDSIATLLVSKPDPRKIETDGLVNGWGGSVHCARYAGALRISFWLAFWCAFIGDANHTRTVFAFCFILESCKHQAEKIECLYVYLVQQKTLHALQGSAILTFRSVHFHPALFTRPSFLIFEGLAPRLLLCNLSLMVEIGGEPMVLQQWL